MYRSILSLFRTGDKVIISSNVYGGTFRVLDKVFKNFGIEWAIEDTTDLEALEAKLTSDVKAILIESPANPLLSITDIRSVSRLAREHGILSIVDNTFMTPYLQRPIELGADIVIHSATKYLGGNSDLVAGLVVVQDERLAERIAFIQNATGGVLGPFDSFLLIRGIKTLGVRMDRHVENAEKIEKWLADPIGSIMGGGEHADYDIEGIGNDFIADTMDMTLVDKIIKISDREAFHGANELAKKEGIFAGLSSGAALSAAQKLIAEGATGNIVVILPDRGDRYFSKNLYE